MDVYFEDQVPKYLVKKLKRKLPGWFATLCEDKLLGEGLGTTNLTFYGSLEPTISYVDNVDEITVVEAREIEDDLLDLTCSFYASLEIELNNQELESEY